MTLRLPRAALLMALPLLAVPAFAEPETPGDDAPETEASEKTEDNGEATEKKICKRIAAQAGSRRATKVCRTREEWKTFNEEQRRRN